MRDYLRTCITIIVIGTFVFVMICLASFVQSWAELPMAAFVPFVLCLIMLPLPWVRASRIRAKDPYRKELDMRAPILFVVPSERTGPPSVPANKVSDKLLEREQDELDRFMTRAATGQYLQFDALVNGVTLFPGEHCCATAHNVDYGESQLKQDRADAFEAVSFHIAPGVQYNVRAFKDAVIMELAGDQERGFVYVTNLRLMFVGSAETLTVKLEKIEDVRVYMNGVAVYEEKMRGPHIFKFDYGSSISAAAIRAMDDQVCASPVLGANPAC